MSYDGITPADLARRLGTPSCLSLAKVTSTMDIIHELAAEGAPAGTVVIADEQVAGRGRQGRRWLSPPGMGIWLGHLVRPRESVEGGVLAIRVGLVVVQVLIQLGATAFLKWPNDVVSRDRKLAGVLCEARWMRDRVRWIAVGIGLNVHGPLPRDVAAQAIALDEVCPNVERITVLEQLVPRLRLLSDAPHLSHEERRAYERHDWLSGRELREPVSGCARGIDEDGALLVETKGRIDRIVGGRVVAA